MIITSATLLRLAIMTPIMKFHIFYGSTSTSLIEICELYQNISNLRNFQLSLEKNTKKFDFKSMITPLPRLRFG
jgi:hypothetical protein